MQKLNRARGLAEAEIIRARGLAEAEVIRAKGEAEADAMKVKAAAFHRVQPGRGTRQIAYRYA